MVVTHVAPVATPFKALLNKEGVAKGTGPDKTRCLLCAVQIPTARGWQAAIGHGVGVDDRIDIDGHAVAVFGPTAGVTRQWPGIKSRRVIIGHGGFVIPVVVVKKPHRLDGELILIKYLKDAQGRGGYGLMDDDFAPMALPVKAHMVDT